MRHLLLALLGIALCFTGALPAVADEPSPVEPGPDAIPVAAAEPVSPQTVADATEASKAERAGTNLEIGTRGGGRYVLPWERTEPEDTEAHRLLTDAEKERFQRNRRLILKAMASVLDVFRYPIGLWQGPIKGFFRRSDPATSAEPRKPVGQLGRETISGIVGNLDRELWRNAAVVARSNEIGASLEGGVTGGGMVGRWGFFGIVGLGLTVSVDRQNKVLVLELYKDLEWAKRVDPGFAGAGVFGTATLTAQSFDWKRAMAATRGVGFCLPGVVGCVTADTLRAGLSKELGVGFPGFAAITSNLFRIPLVRIGISPNFLGFVRIKTIAGPALTGAVRTLASTAVQGCSALLGLFSRRTP